MPCLPENGVFQGVREQVRKVVRSQSRTPNACRLRVQPCGRGGRSAEADPACSEPGRGSGEHIARSGRGQPGNGQPASGGVEPRHAVGGGYDGASSLQ